MKLTQRAAILITLAATWLTLAATAATASPPSVQGTARAAKGCITVTATIPVVSFPLGVAADRKTNTIYVANDASDTVSVISGRTNTVTATVPVGSLPFSVAVNAKTNTIYVANEGDSTVSVLAPCPTTFSSHSMIGGVKHQAKPLCQASSGTAQRPPGV